MSSPFKMKAKSPLMKKLTAKKQPTKPSKSKELPTFYKGEVTLPQYKNGVKQYNLVNKK